MKCSSCGNEMNDAAKFCPYCGAAAASRATGTGSVYENAFRSNHTDTDFKFDDTTGKNVSDTPGRGVDSDQSFQEPVHKSSPGLGIAGMVLGILTIIFCWIIFIAPITGIVGIVLSAISQKQEKNGFAAAGLTTSIIGLALSLILVLIAGAGLLFVNRIIYY